MSNLLAALGAWCFRHRWWTVAIWVVVIAGVAAGSAAAGGHTQNVYSVPGTQSQQAADLVARQFPAVSGASSTVVFTAGGAPVTGPAPRAAVQATAARLRAVPGVIAVSPPYAAGSVSRDRQAVIVTVRFAAVAASVPSRSLTALGTAAGPARRAGLDVSFGGSAYPGFGQALSTGTSEIIGLVVALVVLLLTFGTMVGAGLPLVVALAGVVASLLGLSALSAATPLISAVPVLAIMLGLACGIDYSLFISSRQRSEILAGRTPLEATRTALGTAGGAVAFAAMTVIVALCGLTVTGIPFVAKMGLCAAGAVLIAALAAFTLLPALLGLAGLRVLRFLPGLRQRQRRLAGQAGQGGGARWARVVTSHRPAAVAACVVFLLVLAIPALHLRLGLPGNGSQPASTTERQAYDQIARHFGPGANAALIVVISGTPRQLAAAAGDVGHIAPGLPDVAGVTPPQQNPAGTLSVLTVIPGSGPEAAATSTLVNNLRGRLPAVEASSGAQVLIGGSTAVNIDTSAKIGNALPAFLAVVVGLSLLLLTLAFRTVLVPLKSVIGFLLSTVAAFGIEVAVFQWGWLRSLFGTIPDPTVAFLPVILLAVLFGLSSDYEVFVVSRVREKFVATDDAQSAVRGGLGASARVVTAAALIMFSVFASFIISTDPIVKPIGLTLAAGVLLDAFVVRMSLVPAVLAIAGRAIWYHPRWFDRWVPDFDIEGSHLATPATDGRSGTHPGLPPVPAAPAAKDET